MRKTIFLILVIPILIFYSFGITYAYVITNTQTFNMSEPEIITQSMLGNQGSYYIHEYERENLMFPGAPSSLMLGGNKWVLSGVEFDMSYN